MVHYERNIVSGHGQAQRQSGRQCRRSDSTGSIGSTVGNTSSTGSEGSAGSTCSPAMQARSDSTHKHKQQVGRPFVVEKGRTDADGFLMMRFWSVK
jgi:hypothetical protein